VSRTCSSIIYITSTRSQKLKRPPERGGEGDGGGREDGWSGLNYVKKSIGNSLLYFVGMLCGRCRVITGVFFNWLWGQVHFLTPDDPLLRHFLFADFLFCGFLRLRLIFGVNSCFWGGCLNIFVFGRWGWIRR
jgi:hypothetical protein